MQRVHRGVVVGCRPWVRGWMRGGTLKECQSDFRHILFPPLLVTLWVALAARALGVFGGNNVAEGPVASAPADNDDAYK